MTAAAPSAGGSVPEVEGSTKRRCSTAFFCSTWWVTSASPGSWSPGAWAGSRVRPRQEQKMIEKRWKAVCAFKAALACVGGFVLGGTFGVFTAGIDTNVGLDPKDPYHTPTAKAVKDMGQRGMSYAKNFAMVGAMLSCTECLVESYQGRSDQKNSVISGCITGGAIGFRAGLNAGVIAFSAAIDDLR